MSRVAALVACLAAVAVAGLAGGAATAEARSCGSLSAGGYHRIDVHNGVTCRSAARKLRRWSRHGFPSNPVGWFCSTKPRRKLCSKGNGNAPYFTFARARSR